MGKFIDDHYEELTGVLQLLVAQLVYHFDKLEEILGHTHPVVTNMHRNKLNHEDLKNSLVAKSNIFVMPSIIHKSSVEGFGIVYAEAGQYGVPSIGGKDGGASDAIDHEKTGLICNGNNLDLSLIHI